nr:MAG TPA_asm: hypothetical protein [Caudoviricetes sp.]
MIQNQRCYFRIFTFQGNINYICDTGCNSLCHCTLRVIIHL